MRGAVVKAVFRLFQRGSVWYSEDTRNGEQKSLRTKDGREAKRQVAAKNEAAANPAGVNLQIARTYIAASDPDILTRTWKDVLNAMMSQRKGATAKRWITVSKDAAFETLWNRPVFETRPEELLAVMTAGTICTNVYLRRMHNFAYDMDWILKPIIAKKKWPKITHKETRAILPAEHQKIIKAETNPERATFYELCWWLGGSQGDIASLHAENINWKNGTVQYRRQKTAVNVMQGLGNKVKAVLARLPSTGPLFPSLIGMRASDRATEFKRVCRRAKVKGVTLHSYRYAWAERAAENGYPERYAQAALGHNSKAVARAYARKAKVTIPSLEEYEEDRSARKGSTEANQRKAGNEHRAANSPQSQPLVPQNHAPSSAIVINVRVN